MKFRTTIELGGKTATGMRVPPEVVEALGSGKRPPVRVTINDYTYRGTVAVMDGALGSPALSTRSAGPKGSGGSIARPSL